MNNYSVIFIKNGKGRGISVIRADDIERAVRKLVGTSQPGFIRGVRFTERFSDSPDRRVFVYNANTAIIIACSYVPETQSASSLDELFARNFARSQSTTTLIQAQSSG